MSSRRNFLIHQIRELLTKSTLHMFRLNGVLRYNGLVISDQRLATLRKKHKVKIYNIVGVQSKKYSEELI